MKALFLLTALITNLTFASNATFLAYSFTHPLQMESTMAFISKTNPKLKQEVKEEVAAAILDTSFKKNLDYKLMLSIIAVESSFKPSAKSKTGDFSIVQINFSTWVKEFKRLNKKVLCIKRLTKDIAYSVNSMGEILSYLKRYEKKDKLWFSRYHSNTPSLKLLYTQRIVSKNLIHIAAY